MPVLEYAERKIGMQPLIVFPASGTFCMLNTDELQNMDRNSRRPITAGPKDNQTSKQYKITEKSINLKQQFIERVKVLALYFNFEDFEGHVQLNLIKWKFYTKDAPWVVTVYDSCLITGRNRSNPTNPVNMSPQRE